MTRSYKPRSEDCNLIVQLRRHSNVSRPIVRQTPGDTLNEVFPLKEANRKRKIHTSSHLRAIPSNVHYCAHINNRKCHQWETTLPTWIITVAKRRLTVTTLFYLHKMQSVNERRKNVVFDKIWFLWLLLPMCSLCSRVSINLSRIFLIPSSIPLLFSLPSVRFHHFESEASRGYLVSAGVIQRHLSCLLHVMSSSSNREDSSNHRSISPSLDLFLYLNSILISYPKYYS